MKNLIYESAPIEDRLHVITVVSNPCEYMRRYLLSKEFIHRMQREPNVILYVVELAYGAQTFKVTDPDNKNHLQLRAGPEVPALWHKENMVNIGVEKLLPKDWKAFAWIDSDIEFESATWASDTLKLLNIYDIVQVFSYTVDMDKDRDALGIRPSFGSQYCKGKPYASKDLALNYWHPGYGYAITRQLYDKIGGLFDKSILGSGDFNMVMSIIGKGDKSYAGNLSPGYKKAIMDFQKKIEGAKLGYTPGLIFHNFHGSFKNRKYVDRWKVLVNHKYDPYVHVTKNEDGLIVPTDKCPTALLDDIMQYFSERNEDEGF